MKKIKVAHLYYDIMNLYGENGNIKFLIRKMEEQNLDVELHFLTIDDKIDFDKYDIFYIGTGNEENQEIVLNDLMKYKQEIKDAFDNKKYFILTGNSLELFGKEITKNNKTFKGLDVLPFNVMQEEFRIVGEQFYECKSIDKKIVGFQNRDSIIDYQDGALFDVIDGCGFTPNIKKEGIHLNNLYATYLLGPVLVRNPYFCDEIISNFCKSNELTYKKPDYESMCYKAYDEYIKMFYAK